MFTIENSSQAPVNNEDEVPEMQPISINTTDVESLLMGLRSFKSIGPIDIPAYLLKETANQLAPS